MNFSAANGLNHVSYNTKQVSDTAQQTSCAPEVDTIFRNGCKYVASSIPLAYGILPSGLNCLSSDQTDCDSSFAVRHNNGMLATSDDVATGSTPAVRSAKLSCSKSSASSHTDSSSDSSDSSSSSSSSSDSSSDSSDDEEHDDVEPTSSAPVNNRQVRSQSHGDHNCANDDAQRRTDVLYKQYPSSYASNKTSASPHNIEAAAAIRESRQTATATNCGTPIKLFLKSATADEFAVKQDVASRSSEAARECSPTSPIVRTEVSYEVDQELEYCQTEVVGAAEDVVHSSHGVTDSRHNRYPRSDGSASLSPENQSRTQDSRLRSYATHSTSRNNVSSLQQRPQSRNKCSRFRDERSKSREKRSRSRGERSRSRDRLSKSQREKRTRSRDKRSRSRDKLSMSRREKRSRSRGNRAKSRGRRIRSPDRDVINKRRSRSRSRRRERDRQRGRHRHDVGRRSRRDRSSRERDNDKHSGRHHTKRKDERRTSERRNRDAERIRDKSRDVKTDPFDVLLMMPDPRYAQTMGYKIM